MMSCSAMPPSHAENKPQENPQSMPRSRDLYKVETTADGDVRTFVVEPSFDAEENPARQSGGGEPGPEDDTSPRSSNQDTQSRSDEDDHQSNQSVEQRLSPSKEVEQPRTHSRNLSAHFFDAAKISEESNQETFPVQQATSLHSKQPSLSSLPSPFSSSAPPASEGALPTPIDANQPPPVSPAVEVGTKHQRVLSGDMQSPAHAHRRINSIGNSALIDRRYGGYYQQHYNGPQQNRTAADGGRRHQREDSAGLDMLTAAAMEDVSKEELARVAGPRGRQGPPSTSWEAPAEPQHPSGHTTPRASPPVAESSSSYNYPVQHSVAAPASYPPAGDSGHYPPAHPPHMGYQYPPGHYPPHPYYPPPHYYHPGVAPSPATSYPVQYAQPQSGGHDPYHKPQPPMSGEAPTGSSGRQPSPSVVSNNERIETDERLFASGSASHPMGPPPNHWERPVPRGTTTGVQTHVTALSVGEDRKTIQPTAPQRMNETPRSIPSTVGHHRKLSSFSSLSGIVSNTLFPEAPAEGKPPAPGRPVHHRVTSSSVSFLNGLDENDPFLQSLQQSNMSVGGQSTQTFVPQPAPRYAAPPPPQHHNVAYNAPRPADSSAEPYPKQGGARTLAPGGTSKRIRRKCTVADCPNRVVQGGLCISHGAKRKTCKYPGCTKNVKKAGMCSAHGPARKRCDAPGCTKVAVQGGKCIQHGAKKRMCKVEGCPKQAILSGMCKKHHDNVHGTASGAGRKPRVGSATNSSQPPETCVVIDQHRATPPPETRPSSSVDKPNHRRGLSIFQEMSADSVKTILDGSIPPAQPQAAESFGPY